MPEISLSRKSKLAANPAAPAKPRETTKPTPSDAEDDPKIPFYNIRSNTFRTWYRSTLVTQEMRDTALIELRADIPPLLVDGRMQIIEIPKWKTEVNFLWRTSDGKLTKVKKRVVKLPGWVWVERNFKGKWTELWIQRA